MSILEENQTPLGRSMFLPEVLLTSDDSGQMWNTCLWDPNSGAALKNYKGGVSAFKSTCLLGDTFLISSQPKKPVLNVWYVSKQEQQPTKVTTPSMVNALAASPSGKHIVAAIGHKIFIWQTCTGHLLRILETGHYQAVTTIQFTDDGSYFVSAGKDGNVLAWSLLEVIRYKPLPGQSHEDVYYAPKHSWTNHKLAVTDLHLTSGGYKCRIVSSSLDQTCKIYCLWSGQFLLDIHCASKTLSVAMDNAESNLFIGCDVGTIMSQPMLSPPRSLQINVDDNHKFEGHTGPVTCLSVSIDGHILASGSDDGSVKLWSILGHECIRTLTHKGKITMTKFVVPLNGMLTPDNFRPSLHLAQLRKTVMSEKEDMTLEYFSPESDGKKRKVQNDSTTLQAHHDKEHHNEHMNGHNSADQDEEGQELTKKLKRANHSLYLFALENIIRTSEAKE